MDGSQDQKMASRSWLPKIFRNESSKDLGRTPDERTSLLPSDNEDDSDHATGETYNIGHDAKGEIQLVAHEFWVLFKGSVPVILAYTLQNSLQTISVLIVGRLGAEELAVSAFCYSKYFGIIFATFEFCY
jgi:MATE family multidrug resistance protein